jgi:hypothetical protein
MTVFPSLLRNAKWEAAIPRIVDEGTQGTWPFFVCELYHPTWPSSNGQIDGRRDSTAYGLGGLKLLTRLEIGRNAKKIKCLLRRVL